MYCWLSKIIANDYVFIKNLKKNEQSEVSVYRNKYNGKRVIVRKITDGVNVYEKLMYINNEHLPRVYEVARNKDNNESLIIEEYIDGISIGDLLEGDLFTEEGVRKIGRQVCEGLEVLHKNRIIHRDIKPENVMLTKDGVIKIIDYNASREYDESDTTDTRVLGTTGFAAPEQYGIAQSDRRTDIYALGVMLNVMLTGEHPSKKMYEGKLRKVIEKAINTNPDSRFQTCMEMWEKL